ncbi:MAG: DAK2 domain-containing protein [Lachnospiraceae bacterium]|nr:DAK2 domain-containing protein [Lachnospiraceae bacterium]
MGKKSIGAGTVKKMFLAGAQNLDAKKEWINELNVFPVPDGDTGTNMTMTIMSAAREVAAIEGGEMKDYAKAVSSGTLRGARGNSGVILSQLFRGLSKTIAPYERITTEIMAEACEKAVETAYKAVMKPKEGTILTVARVTAERARELAVETDDVIEFFAGLLETARETLATTPELLPVLKQAGVVDSGGQGLVVVMEGAYDALCGKQIDYSAITAEKTSVVKISNETNEEIKFGYCTEFIVMLDKPLTDEEISQFKAFLNSIGDSIVVVADDEIVKTHVHTNHPGLAFEEGLKHGSLTRMKVDNMREEHEERLIKNASEIAAREKAAGELAKDASSTVTKVDPSEYTDYGYIAVSCGAGLSEIFTGLGVNMVIEGGQTMNPSTDDILSAIEKVPARNVYVFPNNKNIILAANQAADLTEDKKVFVIPTTTVPQGITAMVNMVETDDPEAKAAQMNEDIKTVKTAQITYAVRDTSIDGIDIKKDDYMGITDSGIVASESDMNKVIFDTLESIVSDETGLISIYYGEDVAHEDAEALSAEIEAKFDGIDVELEQGDQPVYYYIFSAE